MSVSSKAADEADKKHISGPAKKRYVGGAINRAKQEKAGTAKKAAPAKKAATAKKSTSTKIAPSKSVVKSRSKLVFGKPPKEAKPKAEYTPKQRELISEIERHYADYQRGKSYAYRAYRDAEIKFQHLNRAAYERWARDFNARNDAAIEERAADRKRLAEWNARAKR